MASLPAHELGKVVIKAALERAGVEAAEVVEEELRRLGIGDGNRIVVYDANNMSAARVWWMFRIFGAREVAILDEPTEGLAPVIADPASGIVDMHLYTVNAVDVTIVDALDLLGPLQDDLEGLADQDLGGERRRSKGEKNIDAVKKWIGRILP